MIKPRLICTTFIYVLIAITSSLDTASADKIRTVALSGQPAPGTAGAKFTSLYIPVINNAGRTAFIGIVETSEVTSNSRYGIWSEAGGNGLELIARGGTPATGTMGEVFNYFNYPTINNAGQTVFYSSLSINDPGASEGIWRKGGGHELELVAREGQTTIGVTGEILDGPSFPLFNDSGQIAFYGFITDSMGGSGNGFGIWSEGGGNGLELIAREGYPAPIIPDAEYYEIKKPVLNNRGQTAFEAILTGDDFHGFGNGVIFVEGGEHGPRLVVREGSPAPGIEGAIFSDLYDPVLNDAGKTAFSGFLRSAEGIPLSNNTGIWSEGAGKGLQLVAFEGQPAPGTTGAKFDGFGMTILNGAGQTTFRGSLVGSDVTNINNIGIWTEGSDYALQLLAREGEKAPGASGAHFSDFGDPISNNTGQNAFSAKLLGAGVNNGNDQGIWAEDKLGDLRLIVREGDVLDVDDGPDIDLRTLSYIEIEGGTGNQDGRRSEFNDRGQIVFRANFTDGSWGIFVSNLVAIPEPTGIVLLALATMSLAARYRLICR